MTALVFGSPEANRVLAANRALELHDVLIEAFPVGVKECPVCNGTGQTLCLHCEEWGVCRECGGESVVGSREAIAHYQAWEDDVRKAGLSVDDLRCELDRRVREVAP